MQLSSIRYGKISICQTKFSLATLELFSKTLIIDRSNKNLSMLCYDIKPVRTEEGKSYWKIPLGDDDATREK